MSDKDRDHAAEQENSAASLVSLDVANAPISELPNVTGGDLDGETTDGEDDTPHPDRSRREPQE